MYQTVRKNNPCMDRTYLYYWTRLHHNKFFSPNARFSLSVDSETMNLYKRGLIFATFLGCSLSAAFLAASISTDYWVQADAKRVTNPFESDGHVFFGLFKGKRELNVGYGLRTYLISGKLLVTCSSSFTSVECIGLKGLWCLSKGRFSVLSP